MFLCLFVCIKVQLVQELGGGAFEYSLLGNESLHGQSDRRGFDGGRVSSRSIRLVGFDEPVARPPKRVPLQLRT
jgi:hypothetical protein